MRFSISRAMAGFAVAGVLAVLLAPMHQEQIHILTSLRKHVAFGAWFGALSAGYVLEAAGECCTDAETGAVMAARASHMRHQCQAAYESWAHVVADAVTRRPVISAPALRAACLEKLTRNGAGLASFEIGSFAARLLD